METEDTVGKRKQKRRTAAERAEVLEQFRRSGLTRIAFSRTNKVALSTLSKWLKNAKRDRNTDKRVPFKELRIPHAGAVTPIPWAVEITALDGVTIRCREALSLQDVSWLLRGR